MFEDLKDAITGGIEQTRYDCAEFLTSKGYSGAYEILHYCKKEGRTEPENSMEIWTIEQLYKNSRQ